MRAFIFGETSSSSSGSSSSLSLSSSSNTETDNTTREESIHILAIAIMNQEVMPLALANMKALDFETRKGIATVFNHLLRHNVNNFATEYMEHHTSLLATMVDGYTQPDVALYCGSMLREAVRGHVHLHEALLYGADGGVSTPLRSLFETHVHNPNFEVAMDAFDTLQTLLTCNKPAIFRFLNPEGDAASLARYHDVTALYNRMLQSDNYVLKRQSLKLLSEFLLDRYNFTVMMKYIGDKNNLKIIMQMLRHRQPLIQFEAFHVFKVFVANPEKPADVAEILSANKSKLITFLQTFQNEKDDEQFAEEKVMLIETLNRMPTIQILPPQLQSQPSISSTSSTTTTTNTNNTEGNINFSQESTM